MSLIIKGREMPSDCNNCPLLQTGYMEHYCPVAKEVMPGIDIVRERHPDCPLIEVPTPHGDLIDRDAFLNDVDRVTYIDNYDYDSIHELCHDRANAAEVIIEAMEE